MAVEEVGYWLSTLLPTQLEMRQVDGRRVAFGEWGEGTVASTFDFHTVDTGLTLIDDPDTSVRCELLTRAPAGAGDEGAAAATAVVAAARQLETMAGAVPAQPGVMLPHVATDLPGSVQHGLLLEPTLWDGQTPHLNHDGLMILMLELVLLTPDEYEIGQEQGVDKLMRRLRRRGTDVKDWGREE